MLKIQNDSILENKLKKNTELFELSLLLPKREAQCKFVTGKIINKTIPIKNHSSLFLRQLKIIFSNTITCHTFVSVRQRLK